jgi:hypothetical protein
LFISHSLLKDIFSSSQKSRKPPKIIVKEVAETITHKGSQRRGLAKEGATMVEGSAVREGGITT